MDKDAEFLKRLLSTFKVEAQEHLRGISSGLLELEKGGEPKRQAEIVEMVFREAHSLKGAARAVNLREVETLCQAMESIFASMKRRELEPFKGLFDLLQETLDFLGLILPAVDGELSREEKVRQRELLGRLEQAGGRNGERGTRREELGEMGVVNSPILPPRSSNLELAETVRVSTKKLSAVLLQAEEMLAAKLAAGARAHDLKGAKGGVGVWKREWGRVQPLIRELGQGMRGVDGAGDGSGELQRSLAKLMEFLEWNSTFVAALEKQLGAEAKSAEEDSRTLGGMVNNLLEEMKQVLMLPFSSLLEILPKVVRDLAGDGGKEAELVIRGEEIEIDRRILEEMKDPLLHLVRNCIDHGIEPPAERQRKGKPAKGTITVEVSPRDNKVELVVSDNGAGISAAALRGILVRLGALPREKAEELGDAELLPFVFQSGISTSPIITELSGRGLGLAIVREKVEKLGGGVTVESRPDAGTRFHIVLPLTVATFRGILVRLGEREFVAPTVHVERVVRLRREEIGTVENRETIRLGDAPLSLARLADVLELPSLRNEGEGMAQILVLSAAGRRIAFVVDEILGEQEVLHKNLGPQLTRVRNISGATVLGSGRVVPILNVPDLLASAARVGARVEVMPMTAEGRPPKRSVLVAEDSITTRTLLKNILEAVGYEVVTAVDGMDAFTRLKSGRFDIVVSDVDMPRMNGFDLTARIRAEKGLEELPVVLVTALASREDRERGIDAGANAYIVKSSFDQSNLLEVMERLV